jgi:hypothetical protein
MPLFFQMLTKFVAEKLVADAHLYELKRHDWIYMDLYTDFVWVHGVRHRALELLGSMAKEAKQDLKWRQGSIFKVEEQDLELLHSRRYMVEKLKVHQGCRMQMD